MNRVFWSESYLKKPFYKSYIELNKHSIDFSGCWVGLALGMLLLLCYANSFHASWQYDDFANIVRNSRVHMDQWSWEQLWQGLTAGMDFQVISRPLAFVSFALNHKFGGLNVFGYHVVNFCIHWTAAIFLFLFVRETLNLPLLRACYKNKVTVIAALSAAFWACHPIHVTAVTYIVQRMASMAGMFYIMAMFFYLKFRTADQNYCKAIFISLFGLATVCALLTKENTLMLGYALLFYDFMLIQGMGKARMRRLVWWGLGIAAAAGMAGLLYTDMDLKQVVASYDIRPFSPLERLLTQPRVMFLYLSLIAMPMTSRMTILHDIEISHAFLSPVTTALSIAGILVCFIAFGVMARKYSLFAYSGLFFFLNHLIEGSFLNLELIYEHRNYIPSMLLFIAPTIATVNFISRFYDKRSFQRGICGAVFLFLISNSYTTFAYSRIYRTELSLWLHAVQRSPRLSLSHSNLGSVYWQLGLWEKAHDEFVTAHRLNRYNNSIHQGAVFFNLGLYNAYQEKNYRQAVDYFAKANTLHPNNFDISYQLGLNQIVIGEYEAALQTASAALQRWAEYPVFFYLSALAHLNRGDYIQSIEAAARGLKLDPRHGGALIVAAESYRCQGAYGRAIEYWERFINIEPNDLHGIIALMELYATEGRYRMARDYLKRFMRLKGSRKDEEIIDIANKTKILGAYMPETEKIKQLIVKLASLN
jgi:tetratricopeptide (TPR) repeat protein